MADAPRPPRLSDATRHDDATLLARAVPAVEGRRIAVVGDVILDCYRSDGGRSHCFPGGAGVIAGHLRRLGAQPVLVTQLANDGNARQLRRGLDDLGIEVHAVPTDAAQPVRTRRVQGHRITATPRQELIESPPPVTTGRIAGAITERRLDLDAVIFADFGHGTVTPELLDGVLPILRPSTPVLTGDVSGPRASLLAMRKFDLLTPTERELRRLSPSPSPLTPLDALGRRLVTELDLKHLLVTRDASGCVRYSSNGTKREQPSLASMYQTRVFDEVGAGDALLAAATLGLCSGLGIRSSVRLGQIAAAAAIAQIGNAAMGWERLHRVIAPQATSAASYPAQAASMPAA
ncbi:PfkB family carbohydrate kinase [Algisphaera agarilytica]|uniref:Sugar/nucleoside kinase (Ribokinase family) n=1 Tax=Algisphaera agarilytica TaxID=1385975 RepID=A0A7X0LJQ4_9BACT|nr:PfkB family carbohydrate kinase [Algisphaera agarilytica]MBB6428999.1 sugar/nucleoside kinase (ribokinase family) [Algisphaera agarilytica]